jgi:hypothetical protein
MFSYIIAPSAITKVALIPKVATKVLNCSFPAREPFIRRLFSLWSAADFLLAVGRSCSNCRIIHALQTSLWPSALTFLPTARRRRRVRANKFRPLPGRQAPAKIKQWRWEEFGRFGVITRERSKRAPINCASINIFCVR